MGLWFNNGLGTLRNVVIQDAGANRIGSQFAIRMDATPPLLDAVNIGPTTGFGIELEGGAPTPRPTQPRR